MIIYYLGNSDVFKYKSKRTGRVYRWERKTKSDVAKVDVYWRDIRDLLEIAEKNCPGKLPKRYFLTSKEFKLLGKKDLRKS